MLKIILLVAVFALVARLNAVTLPEPLPESEYRRMFEEFIARYDRTYTIKDKEFHDRYETFKFNVDRARFYSSVSDSATYGVTIFSDMTPAEFKSKFLMKTISSSELRRKLSHGADQGRNFFGLAKSEALPESFDWRQKGYTIPVKNQGACGSCWAFSAVANLEGTHFMKTGNLVSLSEQNLVDCDHECDPEDPSVCDAGCNGGLMWTAWQWVVKNGGIMNEKDYPYRGVDGQCKFDKTKIASNITKWEMAPTNEDQLAQYLIDNGPISVALNAEWLQVYTGGISDPWLCDPKALDHGVTLVGFGQETSMFGTVKKFWIVRNSWSSSWGENGHFRIARGKNTCGIAEVPCNTFA